MATTPSSIIRFQTSSPTTAVTERRPPSRQPILLNLRKEPEDARITGGTRSLDRRLLALNLSGFHSAPNAA